MKKKLIYIGIALVLLLSILGFSKMANSSDDSTKAIEIKIIVDDKEILSKTYNTNKNLLSEFLIELKDENKILLEYADTEYGMYISGMGEDELYKENKVEGKYWNYSSDNNTQCVKDGYCVAASNLNISDKDRFVFELKAYE